MVFTCGEAMQVNKSSFFSSSFSILLKLSLRSKITIKVFIVDVLDHNSGKCDHLWPDVTSCDHMWPSVTRLYKVIITLKVNNFEVLDNYQFDQLWRGVTSCDRLWPLWPPVTICDRITQCHNNHQGHHCWGAWPQQWLMWPCVTSCDQITQNNKSWGTGSI